MPHLLRKIFLLLTALILLCACTPHTLPARPEGTGQTVRQLHLKQSETTPLIAAWIPYFTVERLMQQPDESQCREDVRAYLQALREIGINTVFVHVCAFGESWYPSVYYPAAPAANGHDAMQVFSDICKELGLSLHAWINPLRLQTDSEMQLHEGDAAVSIWYRDEKLRAQMLRQWDGRWYLNPAAESTRKLLTGVVSELIAGYHPDGIHIDDYFYPTADAAFDASDFAASGAEHLSAWRTENITNLVRTMYQAVHRNGGETVFSVSPQGNMTENRDSLYADAAGWAAADDCCDLLIPQIYFGYQNEYMPFTEVLEEWSRLPRGESTALAVGIAAYKVGQSDTFAGKGAEEWRTESGLPARQAADVLSLPDSAGAAFYHADALLDLPEAEQTALRELLAKT